MAEHRPLTTPLQRTRFWANLAAPLQFVPCCLSSASVLRRQLLRGRPLLRLPCGFHVNAWRVVLVAGFLSVWPIQPHFLRKISSSTGCCPACSHKTSFLIFSGHLILKIRLRQVLMKVCTLCCIVFVVRHVSQPYRRIDLTLELNILSFVLLLMCREVHIFLRVMKAALAFPILAVTS